MSTKIRKAVVIRSQDWKLSIPSFNGVHNATKTKVFICLLDSKLGGMGWLTLKDLAARTGCSYHYIGNRLKKWVDWGYLEVRKVDKTPREYHILPRAGQWLDRWHDIMPLQRYLDELESAANNNLNKHENGC